MDDAGPSIAMLLDQTGYWLDPATLHLVADVARASRIRSLSLNGATYRCCDIRAKTALWYDIIVLAA